MKAWLCKALETFKRSKFECAETLPYQPTVSEAEARKWFMGTLHRNHNVNRFIRILKIYNLIDQRWYCSKCQDINHNGSDLRQDYCCFELD